MMRPLTWEEVLSLVGCRTEEKDMRCLLSIVSVRAVIPAVKVYVCLWTGLCSVYPRQVI